MAYDEDLAARVRAVLMDRPDLAERRMFGGTAFMLGGHMCCGLLGDELIVRLGPEEGERALDEPHTRVFDFTGRPMGGFVVVRPDGLRVDGDLRSWVERGVAFVATLPPKAQRPGRRTQPPRRRPPRA